MTKHISHYLMCGIVTFALHWQTLDGFREAARPTGYKAAFFAATVLLWPITIVGTVLLRDWDGTGEPRNG